jgi:tyrosyl-tRNA synthetase
LAKSNSEARRLIEQGGVSVDGVKELDPAKELPADGEFLLKVGKRFFKRVSLVRE